MENWAKRRIDRVASCVLCCRYKHCNRKLTFSEYTTIMQKIKQFDVPHKPCVYFLYSKDRELLYVGKSSALLARLGIHYMEAKIDFYYVRYIEYDNEEQAFEYERKYIEHYKPKYNLKRRYRRAK
jgi:excinuclease UvrABC nuclease subunit